MRLQKASGYWVAEFEHGGRRKRKRLLPLSHNETDARAALDKFGDARRVVMASARDLTIADVWAEWLKDREKDGFNNAIYLANWKALAPFFANRRPALLTRDDWREYARQRFAGGIAPSTVHTELSRLSNCFKWAASTKLIAERPGHWLPRKGKPRDRVLTPEEAHRLIAGARQGQWHVEVFVVLLFATGARHRAVLDLEWRRADFERGTIDLEVDLPPDPMHKTWRKGRAHVPMSALARSVLERIYPGRGPCGFVIENGGHRLKECGDGFRSACERAGLEGVTPHTIRHTVASWLRGKVQTTYTAQLLGHANERTTLEVYTHNEVEAARPAVEIIDATFEAMDHDRTSLPAKTPRPRSRASSRASRDRGVG